MELLTIQHEDFELSIECAKFETVWEKARNNVGEEALMSTYSWSDGVQSVMMSGGAGEDYLIEKNVPAQSVFFENTDYPIWVDFKDYVKEARFGSTLESDNERFTFHRHILAGYLNYGNEIGRSEIKLVYKVCSYIPGISLKNLTWRSWFSLSCPIVWNFIKFLASSIFALDAASAAIPDPGKETLDVEINLNTISGLPALTHSFNSSRITSLLSS